MSEINGIEERLNDLPGSEALSRLTASRASGWPQLSGAEGGMDMGGEGYILDASGECADLNIDLAENL